MSLNSTSGEVSEPRRWIVHGRVQGVGFRAYTRRAARGLGLKGWVRNVPDGTVEIAVAGPAKELEEFRRQVRQGPRVSQVSKIEDEPLGESPAWTGFDIVYS